MALRRCAQCGTLNAEHADRCSRCSGALVPRAGPVPRVGFAAAPPRRLTLRAVGIAALVGAGLLFLVHLLAAVVPLLGLLLIALFPVPHIPGVPRVLAFTLLGGGMGALIGAVVALSGRVVAGVALAAVLFGALQAVVLMVAWSGVHFIDEMYPFVMGPALVLSSAALGAFFGYLVALTVNRYLQAARGEHLD